VLCRKGDIVKGRALLLLFCGLLLSGCYIQSLNKFYTDDLKIELPRIEGEWISIIQMGDDVSSKKNISPWKFTKDKIETYDENNKYSELEVVYFKIGDDLFMEFTAGRPSKSSGDVGNLFWSAGLTVTYSVCRITFIDDNLIIIPLNYKWFEDRMKEKKLDLNCVKTDSNCIFTAPAEKWISFLKKYGSDKDVFSESCKFVFKKPSDRPDTGAGK